MSLVSSFACSGRKIGLLLVACMLVPLAAGAVQQDNGFQYPKTRMPAPEINLEAVNGGSVNLEQYKGETVLLHFWATFCRPCRHELPQIEDLHRSSKGVKVITVAVDRAEGAVVRQYLAEHGYDFTVIHDKSGGLRRRYEVNALPMTYVIGSDGLLSARVVGALDWNKPENLQALDKFMQLGR